MNGIKIRPRWGRAAARLAVLLLVAVVLAAAGGASWAELLSS